MVSRGKESRHGRFGRGARSSFDTTALRENELRPRPADLILDSKGGVPTRFFGELEGLTRHPNPLFSSGYGETAPFFASLSQVQSGDVMATYGGRNLSPSDDNACLAAGALASQA